MVARALDLRDGSAGTLGGGLNPGPYWLYGVALNADCAVVAAGCDAVTIGAGMQGPLSVMLTAFSGAGCSPNEVCSIETGECVGQDGGVGDGGVVDCADEPEGTACSINDVAGVCRAGACSVGDPCDEDGDCGVESPNCVVGRCSVGDDGDLCGGNGDCEWPLDCELGACVDTCDATCDACGTGCCRDDCGEAGAVCDLSCSSCDCGLDCRLADSFGGDRVFGR